MGEGNRFSLITFELDEQVRLRKDEEERSHALWENLNQLSRVLLSSDLEDSLSQVLLASQELTGAAFQCIYQVSGNRPSLQRIAYTGPESNFPEEISDQDFAHLQTPVLWIKGKRAAINLHKIAHASNTSYIASAPIGETNAFIGLVVASDENSAPSPNLVPQMTFLSSQVFNIIQGHALNSQLRHDIQEYLTQVLTNNAIFNTMEDGAIILSSELIIISLNPSAELYLGYASVEVAGQKIENVLIGSDDLKASFQAVKNELRIESIGSIKLYRRNGESFQANLRIIPIVNENVVHSMIILFQDLSDQEEYKLKNQQLEQRATLGEVTASFAHEVRNPINNIFTGLQLLAINLPQDDPNQKNIARLMEDCERLTSLVKSSLIFVRPMEYKPESTNKQLISNVTMRLGWCTNIIPDQPDQIVPHRGDYKALEQVFTNLINNAIDKMESLMNVSIKIRHVTEAGEQSHIEVNISDTGPGIPVDLREKIFEPFFTTKQHGTGLGLAIVKRIITAHKGSISVTSILGGTNFMVQFPCA
jgi:PAS domain S-box-containing protein